MDAGAALVHLSCESDLFGSTSEGPLIHQKGPRSAVFLDGAHVLLRAGHHFDFDKDRPARASHVLRL